MRANPKAIGAFVLGAITLAVVTVMLLGSGRLFRTTHEYILFFRGDVNGLRVGAPVKFKGVEVGSVVRILLNLNLAATDAAYRPRAEVRIPVIIELDESKIVSHGGRGADLSDPQFIKRAIDEGLRAQLSTESLVTGLLYVDLDIHPGSPLHLSTPPGGTYQEIPTLPTALEQVQSAATRILASLDKVDWASIVQSATETFAAVREIVTSPEVKAAMVNLNHAAQNVAQTSASFQKLATHMNDEVGSLSGNLRASSKNAEVTLKQAQLMLASMQTTLGPDSPLAYQTGKAMQDISAAARAVQQLADYLQRNPSSLVRGRDYTQQPR
jgi:phospholipid/cholesterol/gamma-HCH transport system substrate-binding protein